MKFKGKIIELRSIVRDINDLKKRAAVADSSERANIEEKIEALKMKLQ